jgi:pimeloyl-ACP methyl ester carboxylesterase
VTPRLPSIEEWKERGHDVPFGPHRVFCIDSSPREPSREALVLIHGFPTSSWDFAKIWPVLAERFRVIAADMLGFGFSSKPHDYRYSIMEQANLVEAVVQAHGVGSHHILAHDYGDTVAQELLARDNARVHRRLLSVCFLNGGLFPETHRARLVQKLLESPLGPLLSRMTNRNAFERSMTAIFGPDTPPSAEEIDGFWRLATLEGGHRLAHELIAYMEDRRVNRERWVGAMCDAQCSLAVIDGAADPVSGAHMVARYREVVGAGYIAELAGIGHYPQVEAPALVLEHYGRFLENAGFGGLTPTPPAA